MGFSDIAKVRRHMTDFTLTMNKIFNELYKMSNKLDEQTKVLNAMLGKFDELEEKLNGTKK